MLDNDYVLFFSWLDKKLRTNYPSVGSTTIIYILIRHANVGELHASWANQFLLNVTLLFMGYESYGVLGVNSRMV